MSDLDIDLAIPVACFALVLVILVRELVRGTRLERARDALASERRELLALVDEQPLAPPLWGDVQGDPWPQRVPTLRDELEPINRGRAR